MTCVRCLAKNSDYRLVDSQGKVASGGKDVVAESVSLNRQARFRLCHGWADSDGRLEVKDGQSGWNTVCWKNFNLEAANAICKIMGFNDTENQFFDQSNSYYPSLNHFGEANNGIFSG